MTLSWKPELISEVGGDRIGIVKFKLEFEVPVSMTELQRLTSNEALRQLVDVDRVSQLLNGLAETNPVILKMLDIPWQPALKSSKKFELSDIFEMLGHIVEANTEDASLFRIEGNQAEGYHFVIGYKGQANKIPVNMQSCQVLQEDVERLIADLQVEKAEREKELVDAPPEKAEPIKAGIGLIVRAIAAAGAILRALEPVWEYIRDEYERRQREKEEQDRKDKERKERQEAFEKQIGKGVEVSVDMRDIGERMHV